jgi:hypothetical protein
MNFIKRFFKKQQETRAIQKAAGRPFGSTDEEIKQFFCDIGYATFHDQSITIDKYPFSPSIAYGGKTFHIAEMDGICVDGHPPFLQIKNELIFISAEYKELLANFGEIKGLPIIPLTYIWNSILDPFLDTEFTEEYYIRISQLLNSYGLSDIHVQMIRKEVKDQMMKYNFDTMLWNWTDFGVFDVLCAMQPKCSPKEFEEFYREAMRIALLPKA